MIWPELVKRFAVEPAPRTLRSTSTLSEVDIDLAQVPELDPLAITPALVVDLRSALNQIRADDRDTWIKVAHALRELGDTGRELFHTWSQTSHKYDAADAHRVWESLNPERTSYQTVFSEAQRRGWVNPRKKLSGNPSNAVRSEGRVELINGASIDPEPIVWLWEGHLGRGKLQLFAGAPGLGKTTIALSLAATITSGGGWPDGKRCTTAGDVVMWSGEDGIKDTLLPRLLSMGAKAARVHFVTSVRLDDRSTRSFDPAQDMAELERECGKLPELRLVVIDPVVSAVAGDSNKNAEVRRNLQPLVDLAERLQVTVVGITHFSKGTAGREPLERVTGSVAFGGLARIVHVVAKVQDGEGGSKVLFVRAKSNIGIAGDGFEYSIQERDVPAHTHLKASAIVWGAAVSGSARDLLTDESEVHGNDRGALRDAIEWLNLFLAAGEKPCNEVKAKARECGIAWRTIERAKKKLGVKSHASGANGHDGKWSWVLPKEFEDLSTPPPMRGENSEQGGVE